jgi:hypothetical protein
LKISKNNHIDEIEITFDRGNTAIGEYVFSGFKNIYEPILITLIKILKLKI